MSAAFEPDQDGADAAYKESIEEPTMPYIPDTATALVVHRILTDRMRDVRADLTDTGKTDWRIGERKVAELPDGQRIGAVTYAKGRAAGAHVVDEAKLTAWVEENHPTEVETVTRIRPAYLAKLLADFGNTGGALNPKTGEFDDVPGIEVGVDGDAYLMVKPDRDAAVLVRAAVASGALDVRELLQLEGGDAA